jgi:hypothetical protein
VADLVIGPYAANGRGRFETAELRAGQRRGDEHRQHAHALAGDAERFDIVEPVARPGRDGRRDARSRCQPLEEDGIDLGG